MIRELRVCDSVGKVLIMKDDLAVKQWTDFYKTWYEHNAIQEYSIFLLLSFLLCVVSDITQVIL